MYKNMLIIGSDKSGKTTLANLINDKFDCNVVNLDNIINAFETTFPKEDSSNYDEFETNFIINYINQISDKKNFYSNKKVVLEGKILFIDKIIDKIDLTKISVIGLTYNDVELEKFASDIKEYASNIDMFRYYSNSILIKKATKFIEDNKMINSLLEQYDINSYDVSENRNQTFYEILSDIPKLTSINSTYKVKKKNK